MKTAERRALREAPHRAAHDASVRVKAQPPRDLLRWFLVGWRDEMPEELHAHGTWHDERGRGDPEGYQPVGGSKLGAPRLNEGFRQFLEDAADVTELAELDGHLSAVRSYRYPVRAALARVAGRGGTDQQYPFMALALYRTAVRDGDWDGACESLGIGPAQIRWTYIRAALQHLWDRYADEPQPRAYRPSPPATEEAAAAVA